MLGRDFEVVWRKRDRAALVNAAAVPGGPVASRFRTIERRLHMVKVREVRYIVQSTYSSALAFVMNVSTIRFLTSRVN